MTKYVVRSMTTSDWGRGPIVSHHIYLRRPELRGQAYWSSMHEAHQFDTPQQAEAEIIRAGLRHWNLRDPDETSQVVPANHEHVPDFWEIQKMNSDHK